ncbi:hypothetical protein HQ563_00835 [bacterium]|nr:hypothetical protein [bacterium]
MRRPREVSGFLWAIFLLMTAVCQGEDAPLVASPIPSPTAAAPDEMQENESRFWAEIYSEASYNIEFQQNLIGYAELKLGTKIADLAGRPLLPYFLVRPYKDINEDYWNNKTHVGGGLRIKPFEKFGMYLFLEHSWGFFYGIEGDDPIPSRTTFAGLRGGLAFWQRWDNANRNGDSRFYLPFTGWREIYGDLIYYQRDRDNVIGNLQIREGFGDFSLFGANAETYLRLDLIGDTNHDFWNNRAYCGLGMRIKPLKNFDLGISVEYVESSYFGVEGRDPNPYDQFNDGPRVLVAFWHGW